MQCYYINRKLAMSIVLAKVFLVIATVSIVFIPRNFHSKVVGLDSKIKYRMYML